MSDLSTIAETIKPVLVALWNVALVGLSSSKAAYFAGGLGLGLFLTLDWRKLTMGDYVKGVLACIGLFLVVAFISSVLGGGG